VCCVPSFAENIQVVCKLYHFKCKKHRYSKDGNDREYETTYFDYAVVYPVEPYKPMDDGPVCGKMNPLLEIGILGFGLVVRGTVKFAN
jgi:hypothetical protein